MTTGYAALTARAVAAEQQAARLRAYAMALRGDLVEIDEYGTEYVDVYRHMRGTLDEDVAALAASQPATAAETERACLDCRTPLRTRSVARCYECVERNMLRRQQGEQEADR